MQVQPYLFFGGRCEEAIEFYRSAIGAEVTALMRFKEAPASEGNIPPNSGDKIMHANLQMGDTQVMMTDGECGDSANASPASFQGFSLTLSAMDVAEAQRLFAALSEGGTVTMPVAKTFWSEGFGMLVDRFGVPWMVLAP